MPKGTKILTDVPASERDAAVKRFEKEGATVTSKEEPVGSGKYTITAVFPDSASSDKKSPGSSTVDTGTTTTAPASEAAKTPATPKSKGTPKFLTKSGIPWTVEIDGKDLVVRKVKVTAFGGGHDAGDPTGHTESGVMNDGSNPNLMGCALPIKANEAATKKSPLAFKPPIPWHTKVRFWNGDDETKAIETELIDNGPDVLDYPDHAADLTVAAAKKFAPAIPIDDMATDFEETLSYRIINGANFIPK